MNKIADFLNANFVKKYLTKHLKHIYPQIKHITELNIVPKKNFIWESTYHVVFLFDITYLDHDGSVGRLPIFCSAHSNESRKKYFHVLKYLWEHGFANSDITIARPLFYSNYYKAIFYRGISGESLLDYIKQGNRGEIEKVVAKVAKWLAKLHQLPLPPENIINKGNNVITTVIPGQKRVLKWMQERYDGEFYQPLKKCYLSIGGRERKFLKNTSQRWLVHGDAHADNVVEAGLDKIAMIDFTDMAISDFARDLGTFVWQMEYKIKRWMDDEIFAAKIKKIFLDNYCVAAGIVLDEGLQTRIDNYYNWIILRTVVYLLTKHEPQPEKARQLLKTIEF